MSTEPASMLSEKERVTKRFDELKSEFDQWKASGLALRQYINQKRGVFDESDNRGTMIDHKNLLDGHATGAVRTVASGLLYGMTNPARPWFRLTLDDESLDDVPGVRGWLDLLQKNMIAVMNKSNIYSAFYNAYEELAQFGTSCFVILEDYDSMIRCRSYTFGEYFFGMDGKGRIDTFARKFKMTVVQVIKEFGYESCSDAVKSAYDNRRLEEKVTVVNLICPNNQRDADKVDYMNMPYRSTYWEDGQKDDLFLAKRGFAWFPAICTRWQAVTTDQVYGYGPGWYALGDIKELQKRKLDSMLMEEKLHKPPLQQNGDIVGFVNQLPGGVTKFGGTVPDGGIRAAFEVPNALNDIRVGISDCKAVIDKHFFVHIFQMFSGMDPRTNITATEIAARQQEQIMMLGPILYFIKDELLDPTIDLIYSIMGAMGAVPPPPPEIQGMNLKVKYVSVLAQAQQALGVEQIKRVIGVVGEVMSFYPDAIDVIDIDEGIREISNLEGAPAKLLRDASTVSNIRKQKAISAQQDRMLTTSASAADTANKLAKAPLKDPDGKENVLSAILKGANNR